MKMFFNVALLVLSVSPEVIAAKQTTHVASDSVLIVVTRGTAEVTVRTGAVQSFSGSRKMPLARLVSVRAGDDSKIAVIAGQSTRILENGESVKVAELSGDRDQKATGQRPSLLAYAVPIGALFLPQYRRSHQSSDPMKGDSLDLPSVILIYPSEEPVLSPRPAFSWTAPPGNSRLRLFSASDPTLWLYEEHFSGGHVSTAFPEGWPDLRSGESYFWEVVAGEEGEHVETSRFDIVTAERAREVTAGTIEAEERCRSEGLGVGPCLLVRAGWLANAGYRHEAIGVLTEWLSSIPGSTGDRQAATTALNNLTSAGNDHDP